MLRIAAMTRMRHAGGCSPLEMLSDVACDIALLNRLTSPTTERSESPTPPLAPFLRASRSIRGVETVLFTPAGRAGPARIGRVIRKPVRDVANRGTPSRFCHICSRTAKKVGLVACANLASGACRKVVCEKCFAEYKWDWELATHPASRWECPHCRAMCPDRAQCAIYRRTNERRREQQHRVRVAQIRDVGRPMLLAPFVEHATSHFHSFGH